MTYWNKIGLLLTIVSIVNIKDVNEIEVQIFFFILLCIGNTLFLNEGKKK
jgi:hypothetical protein